MNFNSIFVTIILIKKKYSFPNIPKKAKEPNSINYHLSSQDPFTINSQAGTQLHPGFTFTETKVLTRWNDRWSRSIRLGVPGTRTASPETSSPSCGGTRTWPWRPGRSADRSGNKGLGHLLGSNSAAPPPPRSYRCLLCRPCSSSACTSSSSAWAPSCGAPRRIWAIGTAWGRWNGGQARRQPPPSAPRCPPCPPSRSQAFSAPRPRTRGSAPRSAHPRSPGGPRTRPRRSNASPSASSIGPCFVEDSRCSHLDSFFFFSSTIGPIGLSSDSPSPLLLLFSIFSTLFLFSIRTKGIGKVLTEGVDIFEGRIFQRSRVVNGINGIQR